MDTKNDITKLTKVKSLQCLREIILDLVQSGTEIYRCLLLRDPISYKIIPDIDVSCPVSTLLSAILF